MKLHTNKTNNEEDIKYLKFWKYMKLHTNKTMLRQCSSGTMF